MKFYIRESLQDHCSDYKIRWFWDRYTRSWVVLVYDGNGNEVESSYLGNSVDRDFQIDIYRNQYQTLDARKYTSKDKSGD